MQNHLSRSFSAAAAAVSGRLMITHRTVQINIVSMLGQTKWQRVSIAQNYTQSTDIEVLFYPKCRSNTSAGLRAILFPSRPRNSHTIFGKQIIYRCRYGAWNGIRHRKSIWQNPIPEMSVKWNIWFGLNASPENMRWNVYQFRNGMWHRIEQHRGNHVSSLLISAVIQLRIFQMNAWAWIWVGKELHESNKMLVY